MPISGSGGYKFRNADMADIVQPWVPVTSFSTPRVVAPPPEALPVAFIRVGAASVFDYDSSFVAKATRGIGFRTQDSGDDGDVPVGIYNETGRLTSDVRVENPDDPDQFVVVKRIDRIQFDAPGGGKVEFRFNNSD